MTAIEWTEETWNPTTGCDRVSPGCDNCYALTLAARLKAMGQAKYQNDGDPRTSGPGFGLTMHPDTLTTPLRWHMSRRVFVNSMSDLFHDKVTDEFIARVFAVMALAPQHTFQVLTKRHGRMRSLLTSREFIRLYARTRDELAREHRLSHVLTRVTATWPLPNAWLGVSVEDQRWADIRIPALLETPAAVWFLSCEPLLGPIDLTLVGWDGATGLTVLDHPPNGIDWVIVGGESGPGARPMHPDWVRSLRDQCNDAGVPFFFKQWGGRTPKAGGRILDGRTWDEYPEVRR